MNFAMKYMCYIVGEELATVKHWQPATIKRMKAFAIAIHIPVVIWGASGYVIASIIFELEMVTSAFAAFFCAGLIYMVERLILIAPKVWYVNFSRILIGVIIATLGSGMVDLVMFNKDITYELQKEKKSNINAKYERLILSQKELIDQKKLAWLNAYDNAICEANKKCGSGRGGWGQIARKISRHAEVLHDEYLAAQEELKKINENKSRELTSVSSSTLKEEGLLTRVKALHSYVLNDNAALITWFLCFSLILFFELMVVLTKLFFGETIDDRIEKLHEDTIRHNAERLRHEETSPTASARRLLKNIYSSRAGSVV